MSTGDAEESLSRMLPADWAFAIWAPIFAGWLAYAAHQARPSRRADPLLRRTGWPVAVTTGVAGTWVRLQRRPLLQLPVIAGTTAAAVTAYARAVPASDEQARSPVDRWVVREPVGLTAGWLTLAAVAATTEVLLAVGCRDLWPGQRVWGVGSSRRPARSRRPSPSVCPSQPGTPRRSRGGSWRRRRASCHDGPRAASRPPPRL